MAAGPVGVAPAAAGGVVRPAGRGGLQRGLRLDAGRGLAARPGPGRCHGPGGRLPGVACGGPAGDRAGRHADAPDAVDRGRGRPRVVQPTGSTAAPSRRWARRAIRWARPAGRRGRCR
ncbi:hypothetical protein SCOCK_220045 [Actinacidiphila cocklensis]|uniref:Uncharacterized protein n=1 Tax=Actinacidiphila cocklensis TaxID=887465 RepID=A0A9W4DPB7_9ACTN|nr:hypothetical protein SCOCK_220045 [Actinacidiphila cocklensis]